MTEIMGISNLDEEPEILETPGRRGKDEDDDDKSSRGSDHESDSDAEDDDYEDEDDEQAYKKRIKKKFDKILKDLECGNLDLVDSAKLKSFIEQHEGILSKKCAPKDQTFLHLVAEYDKEDLPVKKIKDLVQALVRLPGSDLLSERDVDGKTPLFCAISMRNHRLVKAMCEAHRDIDSILRIPKDLKNQGSNCLHQAIVNKSSSKDDDLAEFLISKSGPETLCAFDENGMTPLHLAVEYKRCDEAQPRIVQALVQKCDKALDKTVTHKEKGLLSPYRWHEHTYHEAMEKAVAEAKKKAERLDTDSVDKVAGGGDQRPSKPLPRDGPKPQGNVPDIPLTQVLRRVPTHVEAPTGKFGSGITQVVVDAPRRRPPIAIPDLDGGVNGRDATKTPVSKRKPFKRTRSSKTQPKEESALEIKTYLKLYYLRKKRHDDAVEFLYGVQQDHQIYFDLVGCDPKLSESRIVESWTHLVFEDILQYVAIPQLRIEPNPVSLPPGKKAPKPDGSGRTDLRILFNWLKESRRVKTILKVIVEDLQAPAHSDEAIEACLNGMGVEIWDWRKEDLCSEVIQKVSPGVKVVHLYWSGNNAVLRGWSDPEGLRVLKYLEVVYLHVHQGLETRARTKEYVSAFKKRIETDSGVKVIEKKMKGDSHDGPAGQLDAVRDPYERHKWIATMEEFADFLQNAVRQAEPQIVLKRDVVVAVIDDGVDINDPTIQSKIAGGRSFCHRDEQENLNQPYYVSGGGHGTAMAGLISKICPNVKLYILKLNEYFLEPGKRQITAKSAAKAVRAAIDKKVDIISMSWTIEMTDSNKADIEELKTAIGLAASHNILMFCAATDQGAYKDRTYPAATDTKRIFKIGAAEASGAALKWLGDQSLVDFILPGHNVVLERHGDSKVRQYTALTGSSVATALAAGLAALVLYCVQVGCLARGKPKAGASDLAEYTKLKNHERMEMAFRQIGTTKESGNKYITVWNRFAKAVKKSEGEPKDVHIEYVADLAEELMRED